MPDDKLLSTVRAWHCPGCGAEVKDVADVHCSVKSGVTDWELPCGCVQPFKAVRLTKSRPYTTEEVRDMFLQHVRSLVDYWNAVEGKSTHGKLEGLAFSILVALDGSAAALPSFMVIPRPHPDDKDFAIRIGDNYFPTKALEFEDEDMPDIAGDLHDLFHETDTLLDWTCSMCGSSVRIDPHGVEIVNKQGVLSWTVPCGCSIPLMEPVANKPIPPADLSRTGQPSGGPDAG